jgi:hypothetical protein
VQFYCRRMWLVVSADSVPSVVCICEYHRAFPCAVEVIQGSMYCSCTSNAIDDVHFRVLCANSLQYEYCKDFAQKSYCMETRSSQPQIGSHTATDLLPPVLLPSTTFHCADAFHQFQIHLGHCKRRDELRPLPPPGHVRNCKPGV